MTDAHRMQYGVTSSGSWAAQLDGRARAALRRLVSVDSLFMPVGDWGRQDGWPGSELVALVVGVRSHADIIREEVGYQLPELRFIFDVPTTSMRAQLHDARPLWGKLPPPLPPIGEQFAVEWAALQLAERQQLGGTSVAIAMWNWRAARTLCGIACLPVPALLEVPQLVQDLYVARNMELAELPTDLNGWAWLLDTSVMAKLSDLVDGWPLAEAAGQLHSWLFTSEG